MPLYRQSYHLAEHACRCMGRTPGNLHNLHAMLLSHSMVAVFRKSTSTCHSLRVLYGSHVLSHHKQTQSFSSALKQQYKRFRAIELQATSLRS